MSESRILEFVCRLEYECLQNAICRLRTEQRGSYVVAARGYEVCRLAGYALGHGRLYRLQTGATHGSFIM